MSWMAILLVLTNVLTIAWALQLLGRHPDRRLRQLVVAVSVVSLTQTVVYLSHIQGQTLIQAATAFQQCVTSMGSMAAVYLLVVEIRDRKRTDRMLRLAEHENRVMQSRLGRGVPELREPPV